MIRVTGAIVAVPAANSVFEPIIKSVQMINVAPIVAQAGQIDIRADQLQGNGTFDAPTDISVSIVNHSIASLDIHGITIPQLVGGLYLNGVQIKDPLAADANTTIHTANLAAAASDNSLPMATDPSNNALAIAGTANFSFLETTLVLPALDAHPDIFLTEDATQDPAAPPPEVDITGDVLAVTATLHIHTPGDINIQTQTVDVAVDDFVSAHSITISQVILPVSGDPAGQIPGAATSLTSLLGSSSSDNKGASDSITAYQQALRPTLFQAEVITLEGQYVNINGLVQAGSKDNTFTIDPNTPNAQGLTLTAEIAELKAQGVSRPTKLASVSTPNFAVIWDPTVDGGNELQVNDLRVAGGQINIKGRIYSTSQGELNALGNYGNITITNNTNFDLLVHNVDASAKGAGIVQIIDLNQSQVSGGITYYKETTYQSTSTTAMDVQTQYVDPSNKNALLAGSSGDLDRYGRFEPGWQRAEDDLPAAPRHALQFLHRHQHRDDGHHHLLPERLGRHHQSRLRSVRQFEDHGHLAAAGAGVEPVLLSRYAVELTRPTPISTPRRPTRFPTPARCPGRHGPPAPGTARRPTIRPTPRCSATRPSPRIRSRPICRSPSRLTGYAASNVSIISNGTGNVLLDGSIKSTGTTTITSGGDIEQLSDQGVVTGTQVKLTAAGGIGTEQQLAQQTGKPPVVQINAGRRGADRRSRPPA